MAKRRGEVSDDLFGRTEPDERVVIPAEGYTRSISVGMKESEVEMLDAIAEELGVARNAVMRFFLRYAMREHKSGRLEVPVEKEVKSNIDMP